MMRKELADALRKQLGAQGDFGQDRLSDDDLLDLAWKIILETIEEQGLPPPSEWPTKH